MNGTLTLGITYILAGFSALWMFSYLLKIKGNGLKSILIHLFGAWTCHYLFIGGFTLGAFLKGHEIISLNSLRLCAAFFVMIQLTALYRLYLYIKWKP